MLQRPIWNKEILQICSFEIVRKRRMHVLRTEKQAMVHFI